MPASLLHSSLDELEPEAFAGLWDECWLPRAPLAGDVKAAHPWLKRMSRERALTHPHIEANPHVKRSLVVTDVDSDHARWKAERVGLPEPSWVSENRDTGAGHIGYALDVAVVMTDAARRAPVNLLSRVEQGLIWALDGDPAYTRTITKNPHHPAHETSWGPRRYSLRELATGLKSLDRLPLAGKPAKHVADSDAGRNCAQFHHTRHWAYYAIRRYWEGLLPDWRAAVTAHVMGTHDQVVAPFTLGPLGGRELAGIADSIAEWTWAKTTPEGLARWQAWQAENGRHGGSIGGSIGGRRSGETRRARAARIIAVLEEA